MSTFTATDSPEWIEAKSVGDTGEQLVASVLRSIGLLVQQSQGLAANDLSVSGEIECKVDRLAHRTRNAAIEVECRGRPSGISTSTASAWAIVVGAEILLCPTEKLRAIVNDEFFPAPRKKTSDGNTVALIPLADLRKISRRIARAA